MACLPWIRASVLFAVLSSLGVESVPAVSLTLDNTGYSVLVDGAVWLQSGSYGVRWSGNWYSTLPHDAALALASTAQSAGTDAIGRFNSTTLTWQAGEILWQTEFRVYTGLPVIVFQQTFPNASNDMATVFGDTHVSGINEVVASFPAFIFDAAAAPELNFLNYDGHDMMTDHFGRWGSESDFDGSTIGGSPLVLYSRSLTTLVLSPLSDFAVNVQARSPHFTGQLACGLNGKTASVPVGFSTSTVLFAGDNVTAAMMGWGDLLLGYYGKPRTSLTDNLSLQKVGYATDNGAYYYYLLANGTQNYQDTMIEVQNSLHAQNIPVSYYQFDSWWYYKNDSTCGYDGQGGLLLWEPRPDVFPDLKMDFLGAPLWLHHRYVDPTSAYRKNFTFLYDAGNEMLCLPVDPNFFKEEFRQATKDWGMVVYEHDWMADIFNYLNASVSSVGAFRSWLAAMEEAAAEYGVAVMYDSANAAQVVQSVEFLHAVQGSATMDYSPGCSQWKNALMNLLFWSVGLVPWKDTFWTTSLQPGCRYGSCVEPNVELYTLVALLTGGPVSIGDKIGATNRTLLLRTCRDDGVLLKADQPSLPLDATYTWSFDTFEEITVSHTFSEIGAFRWDYILAANLSQAQTLLPSDLGLRSGRQLVWFEATFDGSLVSSGVKKFDAAHPLPLPAMKIPPYNASATWCTFPPCGQQIEFHFYVVAPVLPGGWVLLGETTKFVPMSNQRILDIQSSSDEIDISFGAANSENVQFQLLTSAGVMLNGSCLVKSSGPARLRCSSSTSSCSCVQ